MNRALVRAGGHPISYAIIRVLAERGRASGKELAAAMSKPRSTVGEQLRRLEADGLIECVGEESKRGTVERFYRNTSLARCVDDDEMSQVSAADKRRMALRDVQSLVADASTALAANTLDRRDNWCMASLRVALDELGWREMAEIHRKALEEVVRVREECAERLAGDRREPVTESGEPVRALSSLFFIELPPER